MTRPQGEGCDIGAVEVQPEPTDPTTPTQPHPPGTGEMPGTNGDEGGPEGKLPVTGGRVALVTAVALLVTAAGGALYLAGRRVRIRFIA